MSADQELRNRGKGCQLVVAEFKKNHNNTEVLVQSIIKAMGSFFIN